MFGDAILNIIMGIVMFLVVVYVICIIAFGF